MRADHARVHDDGGRVEQTWPFARRLRRYLAERFPVLANGLLIAAFAVSGVCVSALARSPQAVADPAAALVAFVVLFGLFFQLRVADEHKDIEEDSRHRPERPVPRGLISLAELRLLAGGAVVAQLAITAAWQPALLAPLAATMVWMALMSREFFAPAWLKARPVIYLVSHMAVMPLFALFATACDWMAASGAGGGHTAAVGAFVALSFVNGAVLEIARKCRAPAQEREGVATYSRLWGTRRAGRVVAAAVAAGLAAAAAVTAFTAAAAFHLLAPAAAALLAVTAALRYAAGATAAASCRLEIAAGLWVLVSYLGLGPLPLMARTWLA